ncbi:MAG: ribonuclease HII [Nitrospirae bacterium]|nr:ribonuclease HII [Nitrospirota bacterium]MEC4668701.1 ribonuclease HII [Nitrospirota bacterium]
MEPTHFFETEARKCGYRLIAGVDEAGRGPLAGPVVAAAVILPSRCELPSLNDSKQVAEAVRERLYRDIRERAVGVGIGVASAREIDAMNIQEATRLAMSRAVHALAPPPDFVLIDALTLPLAAPPQRSIIKGDSLSVSIAAASIVAKVTRDHLMLKYHQRYPQYNFRVHKGYPTSEHLRLLAAHGPCEVHRRSFRPVSALTERVTGWI